jgi:HSP20 family protein
MVEIALRPDPQRQGRYVVSDIDQSVGHIHWRLSSRPHTWRPPTDVYLTEEAIIVRVEIAGMRDAQFAVSLDDRYLTISGIRPDQPRQRAYHQLEIHFGEFSTEVELHWAIDSQAVEAEYRDGFLQVVLPKEKLQQIEIGE